MKLKNAEMQSKNARNYHSIDWNSCYQQLSETQAKILKAWQTKNRALWKSKGLTEQKIDL